MAVTDERYQLNRQRILQLLSDPPFYVACIAYFFMRDLGLTASRDQLASACRGESGSRNPESASVAAALSCFTRHTRQLHEHDATLLRPLRDHICAKLGYQPRELVLYYKDQEGRKDLTF